ncbi:MAG TPA: ATPase [Actinobacteria bacterium]|nr:ATPase [Actinomycetota bacterium]
MPPKEALAAIDRVRAAVAGFIRGKDGVIDLALVCLLAEGHLLLDDVPGVGKTSLARALANSLGVEWNRVQFTPDVLPSDVTGVSVFNQGLGAFEFHPGPVFASVVLADEINRATPRTQAALLEAMEERTVSVDGTTHELPSPFIVIATQNPVDMAGTYPLPEAQLDRFLMRASIGYPEHADEVSVVADHHAGARVSSIVPVMDPQDVRGLIAAAADVAVDPALVDYIVRIVAETRSFPGVTLGASPRGSIALLRASRARALTSGRSFATPGDIQILAAPVLAHRLVLDVDGEARGLTGASVIADVIATVTAPQPDPGRPSSG